MNTGLGLNFLRIVNEEGSNGWSQVYARVPFDDVELRSKGALFGVVYGKDLENWADTEVAMMTWVDEYINGLDTGGDLSSFFEEWQKKFSDLSGLWLWVRLTKDNVRELKIVKWGDSGVFLERGGRNVDLTRNIENGKVIKGIVQDGDTIDMWTDGLGERFTDRQGEEDEENRVLELTKELIADNLAGSGLVLRIGKYVSDESEDHEISLPVQFESKGSIDNNEETVSKPVRNYEMNDLVGDRYVGPIGIKEKLANWWQSKFHFEKRDLRIERTASKRKRWAGFLGICFLFLLLISLIMGSIKMKQESDDKKWRNFYEPIEKSRQEAESLVKLNPVGAKKLMEDLRATFDIKKAEFMTGKHKNDVLALEKKINDTWVITSGEKTSDIEEVVKIDLVRPGFIGDRMTLTPDGKLLVSDNSMGVGVLAETNTKDIRVVAGKKEGESWVDITGEDKKTLIMSKTGVENMEMAKKVISFDAAVANPISIGRFMGNIYILDSQNREIFKYAASGDGYGDRTRWLKQGQSMNISPVDMAIDADIWVVAESGQIEKFRRGALEQFSDSGLPSGLKVSRIAVEATGGRIALLDTNLGTIVICNKDNGNCSQQLKSERLKAARDIEFGDDGSLFVLLSGVIGRIK